MQVRATLLPGKNGTKQLVEQYGDQLICVRYRYDETLKRRIKTIELIIEDIPWRKEYQGDSRIPRPHRKIINQVLVRIDYQEVKLRNLVKQAGGQWLKDEKAWQLGHSKALALGLESRIIKLIDIDDIGF